MSEEAAYKSVVAERLIRTVTRCFYGDTTVVVMDALIREKFIREEEMGPRLRLKEKDWRKVINKLEEELLVQSEKVLMEDMRQPSVYYIDYQMFVDIVRYRVFLMRQKVNSATSQEITEVKYKCPTCKKIIGMTEAMLCRSKDYKFVCAVCCPHDDFRTRAAEFDWTLQSEDNAARISSADNLKIKVDEALKANDLHEGILELLNELKDVPLSRNLPSDNMSMGVKNTKIEDEEMESAVKGNTRRAVIGKKGRFVASVEATAFDEDKKFELSLEEDDDRGESAIASNNTKYDDAAAGYAEIGDSKAAKTLGILPEFLDRSGVYGSSAAYNIKSLNAVKGGISDMTHGVSSEAGKGEGEDEEKGNNDGNGDNGEVLVVRSSAQDKDKEEDVDWDDDEEDVDWGDD